MKKREPNTTCLVTQVLTNATRTEDIFRGADFESIFRDLGAGSVSETCSASFSATAGLREKDRQRGRDLVYDLEISSKKPQKAQKRKSQSKESKNATSATAPAPPPTLHREHVPRCNGAGRIQNVNQKRLRHVRTSHTMSHMRRKRQNHRHTMPKMQRHWS